MKQFPFQFIFLFILPSLLGEGLGVRCLAQTQTTIADTNHIQLLVDSCRTLQGSGNTKEAIAMGEDALAFIEQSLSAAGEKIQKPLKLHKATLLRIIGNAYKDAFDLPNALEYYRKCLTTAKEANDKLNMAGALLNMGFVYEQLNEFEKSLDYLNQSVPLFEEIGHKGGLALCFQNLGVVHGRMQQDSLALEFYKKSLNVYNEAENKNGAANQLLNIAKINYTHGKITQAIEDYESSLKMFEEIGDSLGMAFSLAGIGNIRLTADIDLKQAEKYFLRALEISKRFDIGLAKQLLEGLKDIYHQQGRHKEAFDMYDQYISIKDSITNQQNAREVMRRDMNSDFEEKRSKLQAEKEKQAAVAEEESKRQRVIIFSVIGGLVLVVVFSIFILNRWRVTQRQKKIIELQKVEVEKQKHIVDEKNKNLEEAKTLIEEQKKVVEEKNKDITDSINYASRIQRALLTSEEYIRTALGANSSPIGGGREGVEGADFFILFKPKDIVSGDFYWAFSSLSSGISPSPSERVGVRQEGAFYIACCDCTGHGVPGAFMSLLNISFLNEALIEKDLRDTDKILNSVRENVIKALNPDGKTETKDGMDSVFCSIDLKNHILHASCANNPLWIIRKTPLSSGISPSPAPLSLWRGVGGEAVRHGEVEEIPPDKMPVGLHSNMVPFKKHTVQLNSGDIIYLFSDGYADQFGGPKGKKFKYRQLEEVLIANHHLPMNEQKNILEKTFDDWRGNLEQVDDVLVIGIRI